MRRSLDAGGVLQRKVRRAWHQALQGGACLQEPDTKLETLTQERVLADLETSRSMHRSVE